MQDRNYYDYPAGGARPVFQEEYLLFSKDREIRRCGNSDRLPALKNEHARLRSAFVYKLAKYYGLVK
jgi:hypothetical protein